MLIERYHMMSNYNINATPELIPVAVKSPQGKWVKWDDVELMVGRGAAITCNGCRIGSFKPKPKICKTCRRRLLERAFEAEDHYE
jgi:hypothetical protein